MVKCPNCSKEQISPERTWKHQHFSVQAYTCDNCGTIFREYTKQGKHSFTLKHETDKKWVKA